MGSISSLVHLHLLASHHQPLPATRRSHGVRDGDRALFRWPIRVVLRTERLDSLLHLRRPVRLRSQLRLRQLREHDHGVLRKPRVCHADYATRSRGNNWSVMFVNTICEGIRGLNFWGLMSVAISQFTVTICACADKGHCRPACENAIDLKVERAFVKLFYSSLCHMHTGMCRRILLMNAILH